MSHLTRQASIENDAPIALYPASLGVQVVTGVIRRQELRRVRGIPGRRIEVDDAVEISARCE
jgi:hypothetical protein